MAESYLKLESGRENKTPKKNAKKESLAFHFFHLRPASPR